MKEHEKFKELISPFYDGELSGPARAGMEAHLQACPDCREELLRWKKLAGPLFQGPPLSDPEGFVRTVMARLEPEGAVLSQPLLWARFFPRLTALPAWGLGFAALATAFAFFGGPATATLDSLLLADGRGQVILTDDAPPADVLLNVTVEEEE